MLNWNHHLAISTTLLEGSFMALGELFLWSLRGQEVMSVIRVYMYYLMITCFPSEIGVGRGEDLTICAAS